MQQVNGHSSEEEKEEEKKEPWPDDHSSSRWDAHFNKAYVSALIERYAIIEQNSPVKSITGYRT